MKDYQIGSLIRYRPMMSGTHFYIFSSQVGMYDDLYFFYKFTHSYLIFPPLSGYVDENICEKFARVFYYDFRDLGTTARNSHKHLVSWQDVIAACTNGISSDIVFMHMPGDK